MDTLKLRKTICPKCNYSNPIMDLINTINCTSCGFFHVEVVPNTFYIINKDDFTDFRIEICEDIQPEPLQIIKKDHLE